MRILDSRKCHNISTFAKVYALMMLAIYYTFAADVAGGHFGLEALFMILLSPFITDAADVMPPAPR